MNTTVLEPTEAIFPSAAVDQLDALLQHAEELEGIRAKLESGKPVTLAIAQEAHRAMSKPLIRTIMKGTPECRIAMEEMNGGMIALGVTILAAILAVIYAILRFIKPSGGSGGGSGYGSTVWPAERYDSAAKNANTIAIKVPSFRLVLKEISVGNMSAMKKDTNFGSIEAKILFSSEYISHIRELFTGASHLSVHAVLSDINQVEKSLLAYGVDLKQDLKKGSLSPETIQVYRDSLARIDRQATTTYDRWKAKDAAEEVDLEVFEAFLKKPVAEFDGQRLMSSFKNWEDNCTITVIRSFSKDLEAKQAEFEKLASDTEARKDQLEAAKTFEGNFLMREYITVFRRVMFQRGRWASRQAKLIRHLLNHQRGLMRAAKLLAKYLEDGVKSYEERLKGKDEYDQLTVGAAKRAIKQLHQFAKDPGVVHF